MWSVFLLPFKLFRTFFFIKVLFPIANLIESENTYDLLHLGNRFVCVLT